MTKMKKRIIASMLAVVMLVLALVGCGAYDFTEENLDAYVTFNYDALIDGLGKIEIEDGDYTGDPEIRKQKIEEEIFAAISKTVVNDATTLESDKLEAGKVGARDMVYFCYYATDPAGNIYYYSNMKESTITSSSTKAKHVVDLGDVDEEDGFLSRVAAAIKDYDFGANGENAYSMLTALDLDDTKVKAGQTVVVSYSLTWNTYKTDENGVVEKDEAGNPVIKETIKKEAAYERIVVAETSESEVGKYLASLIADGKSVVKVGSTVQKAEKDSEGKDILSSTHKITAADGVEYT